MSWSIGFDKKRNRFIGYGVVAYCEHPNCNRKIDRGLSYVCGGEPYGGDDGCGMYFCSEHLMYHDNDCQVCEACYDGKKPFKQKPEHPQWIRHILKDKSWQEWRNENQKEVKKFTKLLLKK